MFALRRLAVRGRLVPHVRYNGALTTNTPPASSSPPVPGPPLMSNIPKPGHQHPIPGAPFSRFPRPPKARLSHLQLRRDKKQELIATKPIHALRGRGRFLVRLGRKTRAGIRGLPRRQKLLRRHRIRNNLRPQWNRPLAKGVIPAYDEALKVIYMDSAVIKKEHLRLRTDEAHLIRELKSAKADKPEQVHALESQLHALRQKMDILEIQSEANLPATRWVVKEYRVDMERLSHRHLVEQSWRSGGRLDLMMERIHQMSVVPDLLPSIRPSFDLRLTTRRRPKSLHPKGKNPYIIPPGGFLPVKDTLRAPTLYTTVFHADTRLYTLVMIDPDVPDVDTASFTTYLHWMCPNIPLSSSSTHRIPPGLLASHTTYVPPHPQKGTPYHRYSVLLLPQPPLSTSGYATTSSAQKEASGVTSQRLEIPVVPVEGRRGFDLRDFCKTWGLDAAQGGGVYMWREVWDKHVSKVYNKVLGVPEPSYALPPKPDVYNLRKAAGEKKYVDTKKSTRAWRA